MRCEIYVWNECGSKYTTLIHTFVDVRDIPAARAEVRRLLIDNPSATKAHYDVPEFWNQNVRSGWISRRESLSA